MNKDIWKEKSKDTNYIYDDFVITDPANNLRYLLETKMCGISSKKMNHWKCFVPTEGEQNSMYIEFAGESRTAVDMMELCLERLSSERSFKFGFLNANTIELSNSFRGTDSKGALFLYDIKNA